MMKTKYTGFTLLELLIVILIVAILSLIATTSFTDDSAEARRDNRLSLLRAQLFFARIYAIDNNTNVTLCPLVKASCAKAWQQNLTLFNDLNGNSKFDDNDLILRKLPATHGQDALSYPKKSITYRPNGSISGFQSGSFVYCPPSSSDVAGKRITVSQAGRIRFRTTDKCE